jgi:hypothetical protein
MRNPVPLDAPRPAFCLSETKRMTGDRGATEMITRTEAKQLINDLFEEEALVIGGLVAVHRLDDDLVWRLVKNLDVIRGKALRRIEARGDDGGNGDTTIRPSLKPHPAIEDFLLAIRRA